MRHPNYMVIILPAIRSDHSSLLVDMNPTKQNREKCFKYENFGVKHENYKDVIQNLWVNMIQTTFMGLLRNSNNFLLVWKARVKSIFVVMMFKSINVKLI